MNVLVTGPGRSGTMVTANIVCYTAPKGYKIRHNHFYSDEIKNWADYRLFTSRDIREILASQQRYLTKLSELKPYDYPDFNKNCFSSKSFGKYRDVKEELEVTLKTIEEWEPHYDKKVVLEDFFTDPEEYIRDIYGLFRDIDEKWIKTLVELMKKPIGGHMTKSKKLINHDTLTDEQLRTIDETLTLEQKEKYCYIEKYER